MAYESTAYIKKIKKKKQKPTTTTKKNKIK